jgi:hypothetical protein
VKCFHSHPTHENLIFLRYLHAKTQCVVLKLSTHNGKLLFLGGWGGGCMFRYLVEPTVGYDTYMQSHLHTWHQSGSAIITYQTDGGCMYTCSFASVYNSNIYDPVSIKTMQKHLCLLSILRSYYNCVMFHSVWKN